jgi:hypothetical protein
MTLIRFDILACVGALHFSSLLCVSAKGKKVEATPSKIGWSIIPSNRYLSVLLRPTPQEKINQIAIRKLFEADINQYLPLGLNHEQVINWFYEHSFAVDYRDKRVIDFDPHNFIRPFILKYHFKPNDLGGVVIGSADKRHQGKHYFIRSVLLFSTKDRLVFRTVDFIGDLAQRQVPGKPTAKELDNLFKQRFSIGSSQKVVERWIKAHKLSYDLIRHNFADISMVRDAKLRAAELGSLIETKVPYASASSEGRTDILISFFFDKNEKLKTFIVEEVGTGLPP